MELERVDAIIEAHGREPSALIQVLLQIQADAHWLPREALERVAERLGVPLARIRHIASFYKAFSLVPKGRHHIQLCLGTACHVRGAARLLHTTEELTGIGPGETDMELRFSLDTVGCLGCCALGPVMQIDGDIHGHVTSGKVDALLRRYE